MIDTCVHVYPDGRPCRRIPKRGETLCPSHRSRRSATREELFERQMIAWGDHLQALPPDQLLVAVQGSLNVIGPIIERKASYANRATFTRAAIAIAIAAEMFETAFARPAAPKPPLSPAEIQRKAASIDELSALCDRLARIFPPDTSEQNP